MHNLARLETFIRVAIANAGYDCEVFIEDEAITVEFETGSMDPYHMDDLEAIGAHIGADYIRLEMT